VERRRPYTPAAMDWSLGRYEQIAGGLLPAARSVVERAAPRGHEHVLDLGCGTGNAALLGAERGARVTGVDPAQGLLDLAGARAAARGLDVRFILGEASALPLADASAEVIVSVFGVIFADDAEAAIAEMARVAAGEGRIVLCAWIPEGAIAAVGRLRGQAVSSALGAPAGAPPFPWHDREALAAALAPHGFSVTAREEFLAFTAPSPRDFLEGELRDHPAWIAAGAALEPRGEMQELVDRALELLEEANEQPGSFRVSSRYVIAAGQR
jgi:SAM-dependent methyltransferase